MNDVFDMYQELIIDHSKSPKNFGSLKEKTHHALGNNPLCGDIFRIDVKVANGCIKDITFDGDGCAISKASASLMTESLKGKSIKEAQKIYTSFHNMLTKDSTPDDLGKLVALSGVKEFPIRVKCATLCWHTFDAAINNKQEISTE